MNDSADRASWWRRLSGGLRRTSANIGTAIADMLMRGALSPERITQIEEALIRADLGVSVAERIATKMGEGRYRSLEEVKAVLAAEVETILAPVAKPLELEARRPFVL